MPTLPLVPSASRSLPLPLDPIDRGRAKTRINSDPDTYAHSRNPLAGSLSLPPIRSGPRASRDDEPLPGISSIIDQSKKAFSDRRLSEGSPRAHFGSPGRERERQIEIKRTAHSHWSTTRQTRVDSISTVGTDGSVSRSTSPEVPSALSSSFSTIASNTSLSSILEDRNACSSPGPIQLPGFAQLDSALGASPRSAFELSDLRTSLPSEETNMRGSISARTRTGALRSPRSTPLPLSRPMSPAIIPPLGSPHIYPLTRRLKSLMVTTDEDHMLDQAPIDKGTDTSVSPRSESDAQGNDKDETAPSASSIKVEQETISTPSSPASKGLDESDLNLDDDMHSRTPIEVVPPLYLDTCAADDRDENMSCTPTQTESQPWPKEAPSPTTATVTAPSTPVMSQSPPMEPSPLTATMTLPSTSSSPPESVLRSPATVADEEEDSKAGIVKKSESEPEEPAVVAPPKRRARGRGGNGAWAGHPQVPYYYAYSDLDYMSPPMASDPLAHLQQEAQRLGFKLQPDPSRRQPTSAIQQQMMQRQQIIDQLQREQDADAAEIGMSSRWASPSNLNLGSGHISDQTQPPAPAQSFPPMVAVANPSMATIANLAVSPPLVPQSEQLDYGAMSAMLEQNPSYEYVLPVQPAQLFQNNFQMMPASAQYAGASAQSLAPAPSLSPPVQGNMGFYAPPPQPQPQQMHMTMPVPNIPSASYRDTVSPEVAAKDEVSSGSASTPSSVPTPGSTLSPPSNSGTHRCESCGKTFRRPSGLKDHMNIHSGEKPYCCPLETCRKGFATRSNMIRHHNKTHPNRPKIGGVADIDETGEALAAAIAAAAAAPIAAPAAGDAEANMADSASSLTSASSANGTSSQGRFRVVQQTKAAASALATAVSDSLGPMRGAKERRANRKPGNAQYL